MNTLKEKNVPQEVVNWLRQYLQIYHPMDGRLFSVYRPFNTNSDQKKAFYSILNLSPNTNTKSKLNDNNKHNHRININPNVSKVNSTSFINTVYSNHHHKYPQQQSIETNITCNNKQYSIYMNDQYLNILSVVIVSNMDCPLYIKNRFDTKLNPEQIKLSKGAKRIMYEENAGGCSELSEGFSFEILYKCFGAKFMKTEMEVKYWWPHWKKTDYLIQINEERIGVSVTRAMKYNGLFNKQDAMKLLKKKLNGINESTLGVLQHDQWQRQILHIWATDEYIEKILHQTFLKLLFDEPQLVGNTVILVTVASQENWWIFYQDKYFKKQVHQKKIKKKVLKKNLLKNEKLEIQPKISPEPNSAVT